MIFTAVGEPTTVTVDLDPPTPPVPVQPEPGTLVSFPAIRGDTLVRLTGTVEPSRLIRWTRVKVPGLWTAPVIEVRTENLTIEETP